MSADSVVNGIVDIFYLSGPIPEPTTLLLFGSGLFGQMIDTMHHRAQGARPPLPFGKPTVVMDAGIASEDNLKILKDRGFSYDDRIEGHIFLTVLAYHLLHWIQHALHQSGFHHRWSTIQSRNLGTAYLMSGRYQEAFAVYKKSLSKSPDDILTHLGLAICYVSLGFEEKAKAEAAEILRIHPEFSLSYFAETLPYKHQSEIDKDVVRLRRTGLQ